MDANLTLYGVKAFRPELKGVIRDLRVAWLLEELSREYKHVILDPTLNENKSAEYLALSPTGKVPALQDGDLTLFESAAILEYLADKHDQFFPEIGSIDYYEAKQWNYFVVSNVDPQVARVFACDVFYEQNETTQHIRSLALDQIPRFFSVLEKNLSQNEFLLGENFSIADILLATSLNYIRHSTILNDYPHLNAYHRKCTSRPAYLKAYAMNGGA